MLQPSYCLYFACGENNIVSEDDGDFICNCMSLTLKCINLSKITTKAKWYSYQPSLLNIQWTLHQEVQSVNYLLYEI